MAKRFKHIYLEITDICDRHCSFCPEVRREKLFMPADEAENYLKQIAELSEAVYFHIQGEPLLHPDFERISSFAKKCGLILKLTTNASHLKKYSDYLLSGIFYQINFSMQSLNEVSVCERLRVQQDIADFTLTALDKCPDMYINFRWWQDLPPDLDFFCVRFGIERDRWLPVQGRNNTRIIGRLYSSFDREFVWPSESSARDGGSHGTCKGLIDHCGILCDGRVVPCCLDAGGELVLGNLLQDKLLNILESPQACAMADGFRHNKCIHKLCRNCNFARRFDLK
ncbi:MAG: SPASM domain-containing protein [Lentisphaeria bacterium]|nr:SPASM domain-containing protein [Lentisphaeria bacterium]